MSLVGTAAGIGPSWLSAKTELETHERRAVNRHRPLVAGRAAARPRHRADAAPLPRLSLLGVPLVRSHRPHLAQPAGAPPPPHAPPHAPPTPPIHPSYTPPRPLPHTSHTPPTHLPHTWPHLPLQRTERVYHAALDALAARRTAGGADPADAADAAAAAALSAAAAAAVPSPQQVAEAENIALPYRSVFGGALRLQPALRDATLVGLLSEARRSGGEAVVSRLVCREAAALSGGRGGESEPRVIEGRKLA